MHAQEPRDLEYYRKLAKERVRGRRDAGRDDERYLLADAQHELAVERGFRSWAELRRVVESRPMTRRERLQAELDEALPGNGDVEAVSLDLEERYPDDTPVRVNVRRRGSRYDIDDAGTAVELAGRPAGFGVVAEEVVRADGLNVSRLGVVFVPAVAGRDLVGLVERIGAASLDVYAALVELDDL